MPAGAGMAGAWRDAGSPGEAAMGSNWKMLAYFRQAVRQGAGWFIMRGAMFTPTRLSYIIGAVFGGGLAGGYVAWAVAARFDRIAALTGRADLEANVLVVLCAAGFLLAFPLGAAAGLLAAGAGNRLAHYLRRRRGGGTDGGADGTSWVTRRAGAADDRGGD